MIFIIYLTCGVLGVLGNFLVLGPLIRISSYHKAIYILLTSVVISDICTCLVLGCWASVAVIFNLTFLPESVVCFICVCCQFVTFLTYPALGAFLWRCAGQCRRSPLRKTIWCHRSEVAIVVCIMIWLLSVVAGIIAVSPTPVIQLNTRLGSIAFMRDNTRGCIILWLIVCGRGVSFIIQWVCNIGAISQIYGNGVQRGSRSGYRQQIQLFFQYFFPSIMFTLSIWTYWLLPLEMVHRDKTFARTFQLLWLVQSTICPCFYLFFNNRLSCSLKNFVCLLSIEHASVSTSTSQRLHSTSEYSSVSTSRKSSKPKEKIVKRCISEPGYVENSDEGQSRYRSSTCVMRKQAIVTTDKAYPKVQFLIPPYQIELSI